MPQRRLGSTRRRMPPTGTREAVPEVGTCTGRRASSLAALVSQLSMEDTAALATDYTVRR
jgi:hypothetical protein